ncbi:helix-turn-helix domain-containing protein [Actinacidiphila soli]|uniref:hypothetical protein n=1 Tax=Actinacidiphila soli TaxID=2487275 RepID=UPI0019D05972|nr:hypothetical protein [Actinacidiphila soli]
MAAGPGRRSIRISEIENGDLEAMELETLRAYAAALGGHVDVTVTRRVLRHGDCVSRDDLIDKMDAYMIHRNETASPFRWSYDGSPLKAA